MDEPHSVDPGPAAVDLTSRVNSYLAQLAHLAAEAEGSGQAIGQAAALAEAQRISAWGLKAAVRIARDQGLTWRDLSQALDVPAATLHRHYQSEGEAPPPGAGAGRAAEVTPDVAAHHPAEPGESRTGTWHSAAGNDLFVGRQRELADLPRLLAGARLVTLVGTAGVGKTRLAAESAQKLSGAYRDGVVWADLAPLADPALIGGTIVAAYAQQTGLDQPLDRCLAGQTLLVLDNCEHLLPGVVDVVERLRAANPRLRLLTTSREPLLVPGEVVVALQPLPPVRTDTDDAELLNAPAVRLFADRAHAAAYDLNLSVHLSAIAELCNRLDGLPLAIELAASQIRLLPPDVLLARVANRLDLLTGSSRVGVRHRGLREAIEWSYTRLDDTERMTFRRLALLPGGFDQYSAVAVIDDASLRRADLWALIAGLQAKSLVICDAAAPGRFQMLESLRAFGSEKVEEEKEQGVIEELLISWIAGHARAQLRVLLASADPHLLARTVAEHENIRFATSVAERRADPRWALLANLLALSLTWRGEPAPARELLQRVLARNTDPESRIHALSRLSAIHAESGDLDAAKDLAEKALERAHSLGDEALELKALTILVYAHQDEEDVEVAIGLTQQQVKMLRHVDSRTVLAVSLNSLACLLLIAERAGEAEDAIAEAIALTTGDDPYVFHTAGAVALTRSEVRIAGERFLRALHASLAEQPNTTLECVEGLALAGLQDGAAESALRLLAGARHHKAEIGWESEPWWAARVNDGFEAARSMLPTAVAGPVETSGADLTMSELLEYATLGTLPAPAVSADSSPLTPREAVIAALVAEGYTNEQIAARTGVSGRTVANHLSNVRVKLGLPNRAAVAAWVTHRKSHS
jgi:predicted ATPase/DNA-binding CsgD family transcriptional regulator